MTQANPIRVAVAGAHGRMGKEAMVALNNAPDVVIAGALVRSLEQTPSHQETNLAFYSDPVVLIDTEQPDVWLDLTTPESVVNHVDIALHHGVRAVVGATGYRESDIERWRQSSERDGVGVILCPNFALGALLMMRFAKEAAKWMESAEIIELHHNQKKDKPSGTSKRTAEQMDVDYEVPIHSVRLPGLVAHQEVLFGGQGETLTIRHDSLSRESFMPGVLAACRGVVNLKQLVVGLEHLLW